MSGNGAGQPKFRDAAVVVMVRGHGADLEAYWVLRSAAVAVQPGFHAFPGGKVDAQDAELPLAGLRDDALRVACACAIREAFEETGVLLGVVGAPPAAELAAAHRRLEPHASRAAGPGPDTGKPPPGFAELAREYRWTFDASQLAFAGRWQTPPFAAARFDTLYFLARVPEGQAPHVTPGELESGEWIWPAEALARWRRGEVTFVAPILSSLREIEKGEHELAVRLAAAPERAGQPVRRIEMQWGVILHPMRTRPLPPATHTNAYLIGDREMVLLDPGSDDPAELAALFALTDALSSEGRKVALIVATHHHGDHTAGIAACRERYRVPVAGHEALAGELTLDRVLRDGDTIDLAAERGAWTLNVIATPGHTRDSLSLYLPRNRALFCGDLLPGGPGSVIIDPPDGDLAEYLGSLERVAALEPVTLFPAHGSPQGAAVRRIRALIAHRLEREAKVVAALGREPQAPVELLPAAYADTPPELWPYAERSLLAHLLKLEHERRAVRQDGRWRAPE